MVSLLPVFYLIIGILLGKAKFQLKKILSTSLTKVVIPLVIIWNVSHHIEQMIWIILAALIVMTVLFLCKRATQSTSLDSLCFCYLNIGWLGLPIAQSLLGDEAARYMLAAYIGSSIFGNSIGANFLSEKSNNIYRLFFSPPVIAVLLGCLLIPFNTWISEYFYYFYQVIKVLMSFLGMVILGLWLSEASLNRRDVSLYFKEYFSRAFTLLALLMLIYFICYIVGWNTIFNQLGLLALICLLPPAANIIVLETYYLGTGVSAARISYETLISLAFITVYCAIVYVIA